MNGKELNQRAVKCTELLSRLVKGKKKGREEN
jgi:hypothetical protein